MLLVVPDGGLADPPGGLVGRFAQLGPGLEHPGSAGVRLDPGDVPRLTLHRREEDRVEPIDVDLVPLVGPCEHPLELARGLGKPGPEMGHHVADRPVGIHVVARNEALLGRQGSDELDQLVPPGALGLDLGQVGVVGRHRLALARIASSVVWLIGLRSCRHRSSYRPRRNGSSWNQAERRSGLRRELRCRDPVPEEANGGAIIGDRLQGSRLGHRGKAPWSMTRLTPSAS